jgi:surfeit locus 1 family protein
MIPAGVKPTPHGASSPLSGLSGCRNDFGWIGDPTPQAGENLTVWNLANVEGIASQLPYPILPVYIQRAPDASLPADVNDWTDEYLPFPSLPEIEITEGPHMGYALQWFTFAAILAIGYPIFLTREKE